MTDKKRRELFADLYRLAEYYENPPFRPGEIEHNAKWFEEATDKEMKPFLVKYKGDQMAMDLALALVDDASRRAAKANRQNSYI